MFEKSLAHGFKTILDHHETGEGRSLLGLDLFTFFRKNRSVRLAISPVVIILVNINGLKLSRRNSGPTRLLCSLELTLRATFLEQEILDFLHLSSTESLLPAGNYVQWSRAGFEAQVSLDASALGPLGGELLVRLGNGIPEKRRGIDGLGRRG